MDIYRKADVEWKGTLKEGSGTLKLGSGAFEGPYTWASRFSDGPGANPEELIGAALAGCYSMFLSALLTNAGFTPDYIRTTAKVHLVDGPTVSGIELTSEARVPGVEEALFMEKAAEAKAKCPISKALSSVEITLNISLVK